ncbi:hypothetical protein [Nostoc sphaeroides]|uniref:IS4 transposase n=1 Tax=Nostoc sphaeroides CCNUC1 TaxID=2653204 RepID=A0A5P8W0I6_9NOSO|nr:hypothetical protein [Nostoc sphaeroides]MCC5630356.1 hypothetical protein [Nostoc sphaeroides CHAB 2801]QFS46235.1 IS4 transposase [Nostoc sphaeroides CCNUC1]
MEQGEYIVTTDRGLYAEWLYQQILNCGWHPFMRINLQGQFKIKGTVSWLPLNQYGSVKDFWY